jgi:hypothetical protein
MENQLPHWLQKELEWFGLFEVDAQVIRPKNRYLQEEKPVVWKPAYPNQEPPF